MKDWRIKLKKRKKLFVFIIIYLAYTSIYIARVNVSIAGAELTKMNILDSAQIGVLGSCFFVFYAVGRIVNGGLSGTAPPWVMLTAGLAVCGIANLLMSLFPPFAAMIVFWTVNAYAQSMLWSSILCAVTSMYDKETAKSKMSVMITSVAAGNILGIVINTYLITRYGARFAFIIPGLITIALSIFTFMATKNIKNTQKSAAENTSKIDLLKDKELVQMNIAAMIHGVMKENIGLWMAVYVVDTYFVDLRRSSYYILLIPAIGFIGRFVYPALYKLCRNNENTVSLIGFSMCIAESVLLCFDLGMIFSVLMLSVIYMAVSMINTSMLSIYPLSYAKTGNTATVGGMVDFSTYLGAGISSAVYGTVIKRFGYLPMFISWGILSLAAFLIILKINKKRNHTN